MKVTTRQETIYEFSFSRAEIETLKNELDKIIVKNLKFSESFLIAREKFRNQFSVISQFRDKLADNI